MRSSEFIFENSIIIKFNTISLAETQLQNYAIKYFECYNIEQSHSKFISNVKRLASTKLTESEEYSEIQPFIDAIHRVDVSKKIKVGDMFAVLNFEINFAWKEIIGTGFITPKEVANIKLRGNGSINYIQFTDGDRYPRLNPATFNGKPIMQSAYFVNENDAEKALTMLSIAVPNEWTLDLDSIQKNNITEDDEPNPYARTDRLKYKAVPPHKPSKVQELCKAAGIVKGDNVWIKTGEKQFSHCAFLRAGEKMIHIQNYDTGEQEAVEPKMIYYKKSAADWNPVPLIGK
jgi:hypothetical protein